MMNSKDEIGLSYTGANPDSLVAFQRAQAEFQCYVHDPVATVESAIATSPDFVMAHLFHAYLHLLGTEPGGIAIANTRRDSADRLGGNWREKAHIAAVSHLLAGRWRQAGRVLEDISIACPEDSLALQAGHLVDFYTGNSRMLRDRIARALPIWSKDMPGYHAVLGMYAFGLEESGNYTRAEALGREAVALNSRDGWAQHAVAHVMEMQGRVDEGIKWMRDNADGWSQDSFFQVHNWWHLALFYLDQEDVDTALNLFDQPIYGKASGLILDMVDASALLWRLHLLGFDAGSRWQPVADNWAPVSTAGNYCFNDVHAAMTMAGSGRFDVIDSVVETQRAVMAAAGGDNVSFIREVGHPLTLAIRAFAEADYAAAIELIRPVRGIAHRFGGSHAQRDVIDLTLIEAALRGGENSLARALVNERLAIRPDSPANKTLLQRCGGIANRPASSRIAVGAG